jgi:hypothetical protein
VSAQAGGLSQGDSEVGFARYAGSGIVPTPVGPTKTTLAWWSRKSRRRRCSICGRSIFFGQSQFQPARVFNTGKCAVRLPLKKVGRWLEGIRLFTKSRSEQNCMDMSSEDSDWLKSSEARKELKIRSRSDLAT